MKLPTSADKLLYERVNNEQNNKVLHQLHSIQLHTDLEASGLHRRPSSDQIQQRTLAGPNDIYFADMFQQSSQRPQLVILPLKGERLSPPADESNIQFVQKNLIENGSVFKGSLSSRVITSDSPRGVVGGIRDLTRFGNLNELSESQKISLLQTLHRNLDEQAGKKSIRDAPVVVPTPQRFENDPIKADDEPQENIIQQLPRKHLFGIQEIIGYKHVPLSSKPGIHTHSSVQHETESGIQSVKLEPSWTSLSSGRSQFSEVQKQSLTSETPENITQLSYENDPLANSLQQIPGHFPVNQLLSKDVHQQLLAKELNHQSARDVQNQQDLTSQSPVRSRPHREEPSHGANTQFLKLTRRQIQNPLPQPASHQTLSQQSVDLKQPVQKSIVNQEKNSSSIQESLTSNKPLRSERTTGEDLRIVQLDPIKLSSSRGYYPRLPLEAASNVPNLLGLQAGNDILMFIAAMNDHSTEIRDGQRHDDNSLTVTGAAVRPARENLQDAVSAAIPDASPQGSLNLTPQDPGNGLTEVIQGQDENYLPHVPLQRQGYMNDLHQVLDERYSSALLQSSIGRDFLLANDPSALIQEQPSSGILSTVVEQTDTGVIKPDIVEQLNKYREAILSKTQENFQKVEETISEEAPVSDLTHQYALEQSNHFREHLLTKAPENPRKTTAKNFGKVSSLHIPALVPRPVQISRPVAQESVPVRGPRLKTLDTSGFQEMNDIEETLPAPKLDGAVHYDSELKFFPKNGYDISHFFRGFPAFGYFHKKLDSNV
ncbi:uncharacterized protein LOC108672606 [Hyalella azteca]|uniref:Uncharacterized protein LOC108672606 n=1 Tax=Hyalella azteca TaxID=294128 RepID=A0A8B7NPZ2_HYAAZ|nr:uncharacterized protein LOC108672606 [Hyalella azteca]